MKENIKEFTPSTEVKKTLPLIASLKRIAQTEYGVDLGFFDYQNNFPGTEPKSGLYAVVVPDVHTLGVLMDGTVDLRGVLLDNAERHPNEIPCYYNTTYLGDISPQNMYEKTRQIEKAIRNISCAKYAFQEFGYDLPRTLQQITIDKFSRYDNIRRAQDLRPEMRSQYEQVMKDAVIYADSIYNKENSQYEQLMRPAPKWQDNLVEHDYFEKNHIIQVNDVVSEDFWEYLKERMPESPGFHIWKDKKPSLVLKDNSDAKGIMGINIWSKQKGYKEFNVSFARGQQDFFYTWLLDYQHRNLTCCHTQEQLLEGGKQLTSFAMPSEDVAMWDAYCATNSVKYCINHGLFGHNTPETIRNPIVGIRQEDTSKASAILKRMAEDRLSEPVYSKDRIQELDKMKRKSVVNPYLRLMNIQARTDVWLDELKAAR